MKLIKKINNNFALALNDNDEQIIVNGKGIGFLKMPCELLDYSLIERTFYNASAESQRLIQSIPDDIMKTTSRIMNLIEPNIFTGLNPNLFFVLADHINFCIERNKKGIDFEFPAVDELEQMYSKEIKLGYRILEIIKEELNVHLKETEVYGFAMNIINAETENEVLINTEYNHKILTDITSIIEKEFDVEIDRTNYIYKRFRKHIQYLLVRIKRNEQLVSDVGTIQKNLAGEYLKEYKCAVKIVEYLKNEFKCQIENEELVYIVFHLNCLVCRLKNE